MINPRQWCPRAESPAPLVAERASPLAAAQNKLDLEKAEALAEDFLRRLLALEDKGSDFGTVRHLSD